jgi:hypothetical protein
MQTYGLPYVAKAIGAAFAYETAPCADIYVRLTCYDRYGKKYPVQTEATVIAGLIRRKSFNPVPHHTSFGIIARLIEQNVAFDLVVPSEGDSWP